MKKRVYDHFPLGAVFFISTDNSFTSSLLIFPVATIFAWSGALRKRGELDQNDRLMKFADSLEKAVIDTIESGKMTKDLAAITALENVITLNSEEFIQAIAENLRKLL